MSTLRLAVAGVGAEAGSRARGYLATIKKLPHLFDLCAICDAGDAALRTAGELFDVPARYTRIETLLKEQKPDVFLVLLPTDGQTVAALAGIDHGCHVITEIPYALTLDMGDAIAREAGEKGLKWEVAENVWLWPNERLKQKIARAGVMGKLTHARLRYPAGSYHGLNAVRMILDSKPRRARGYAQAVEVPPYQNYGGGDETTRWWESGVIEFENDVACIYEMPTAPGAASGMNWDIEAVNGYLSGNELTLYGSGARNTHPIREIHEEVDGERVLTRVQVDTDPPIAWENPYRQYGVSGQDDVAKAAIMESLYTAVTRNASPRYGAEGGRLDYETWVALRESAETGGGWVDIPLNATTSLEARIRAEFKRYYGGDPVTDAAGLLNASFGRLSAMWTVAGWL
ncbi:MAG: Gfo/Idh/MocA family oxidoreductase [Gemmatimonadota bacterium]|nr:Gfo/Idh/MocA family oxidoreductase [Gemmatimonadota bacterium]